MLAQILRVVDSLQLTAKHSVATPVNWQRGDRCMVVPSLTDEQAKAKACPCSCASNCLKLPALGGRTIHYASLDFPLLAHVHHDNHP